MKLRPQQRTVLELAALVLVVAGAQQWWAARADSDIGAKLAATAQYGDIRMLASETCAVCMSARIWFAEHHVSFTECTIEQDAACRADFDATRAPGTPLMMVRGQPQVGFSPERLLKALQAG